MSPIVAVNFDLLSRAIAMEARGVTTVSED